MSLVKQTEMVVGYGVFDEDWNLRASCKFPSSPQEVPALAGPYKWHVTQLKMNVEPYDDPWDEAQIPAARRGPFVVTQVALLREDATPIDMRSVDEVVVPDGFRLDEVVCSVRLDLPY